jgi:chitodextrinase
VHLDFGSPQKISDVWHASVFNASSTTATLRLDIKPGTGHTFQIKGRGQSPEASLRMRVGDACAGAKFELTRPASASKTISSSPVSFSAAVTPACWIPYQPMSLSVDSKALMHIAVSHATHASLTGAGGRRANFALESKGDAQGRFTFSGIVRPSSGHSAFDAIKALNGAQILCRALRLPPLPPAPPPPPAPLPIVRSTYAPQTLETQRLSVVDAPRVVSIGCTSLALEWDAVPSAGRYKVNWQHDTTNVPLDVAQGGLPRGSQDSGSLQLTGTQVTLTGLAAASSYSVTVHTRRSGDGNWGSPSVPASARTHETCASSQTSRSSAGVVGSPAETASGRSPESGEHHGVGTGNRASERAPKLVPELASTVSTKAPGATESGSLPLVSMLIFGSCMLILATRCMGRLWAALLVAPEKDSSTASKSPPRGRSARYSRIDGAAMVENEVTSGALTRL